ncbi:MAG: hypothetical protein A3A97_02415 [Candidatus Terrybacteria bacterium RIFCSPLOWO2_01_FULL_40_23]|uniref:glucose-1-phosphate thymidylyltransferase n=1 Tax=Candidatus Terrybacteria bacterium RIFCSPLOWO2_01_FULL_40_23 TaxID=1802366 RepID=A0A1G2PSG2_9BACT|nr:MAG: hypothetical protein A3A97_02415 [Candidatus Terrybacteria bacterium RIFCSPLOWO2_01_FULL_40_23]
MTLKGLILAGGKGTRLHPCTDITNKHLLPVWDRPMIDWALMHLADLDITDPARIGIVIGDHFGDTIRNYLGPKYQYIEQGPADGIGNAVRIAHSFIQDSPFVVHLGDQIYTESLLRHYQEWQKQDTDIHVMLRWYEHANRHTVVSIKDDRITGLVEKPKEPEEGFVMVGISFYKSKIFSVLQDLNPGHNSEYQLSDAITLALKRGLSISYSILEEEWVDAGTPENLLYASHMIKKWRKEENDI